MKLLKLKNLKFVLVTLTIFLLSGSSFGQDNYDLKAGDVLAITKETNTPFNHLHFPRANFIIKRGGIADFKTLDGMKVKIEEISEDNTVKLIPLDGKKFFNRLTYVNADLEKALESNELKLLSNYTKSIVSTYESK